VQWSSGRNREATAYHAEAVAICERLGLSDLAAVQAYHGRGESHFFNLEHVQAIRCYQRSIELAQGIGDKSYECENLMMIAHARSGYLGLGDYAQARANFEGALEIAERADLQWHIPPTRLGLACVTGYLGDYAGAVTELLQMTRSLERSKLPRYQVMAYEMLASLLLDVGLDRQALRAAEKALAVADAANNAFWRVRTEATCAIARLRLGDLDVAAALTAPLRAARDNDERSHVVRCLEGLAELALRRGELEACTAVAAEMLTLAEGAAMPELAARARLWRGRVLAARGELRPAVEELELAATSAEQLGRVRLAKDACAALAEIADGGAHPGRAAELAARLDASARECERLMAAS
jgi:tetratricopeptide (TPR) repeat protein